MLHVTFGLAWVRSHDCAALRSRSRPRFSRRLQHERAGDSPVYPFADPVLQHPRIYYDAGRRRCSVAAAVAACVSRDPLDPRSRGPRWHHRWNCEWRTAHRHFDRSPQANARRDHLAALHLRRDVAALELRAISRDGRRRLLPAQIHDTVLPVPCP